MTTQRRRQTEAAETNGQSHFRVRATKLGWLGLKKRPPGDVFEVSAEEFSPRWMVKVDASTPLRSTTPESSMVKAHIQTLRERGAPAVRRGSPAEPNLPTGTEESAGSGATDVFADD